MQIVLNWLNQIYFLTYETSRSKCFGWFVLLGDNVMVKIIVRITRTELYRDRTVLNEASRNDGCGLLHYTRFLFCVILCLSVSVVQKHIRFNKSSIHFKAYKSATQQTFNRSCRLLAHNGYSVVLYSVLIIMNSCLLIHHA